MDYTESTLWLGTLAPQEGDNRAAARERLRSAYIHMRERAALLGGEIASRLPEYTQHDITHIDAIWEMASLVTPDDYLNPLEAFCFGAAALIHDLGMALAAYPDGEAELMAGSRWRDVVFAYYRSNEGREPSEDEIASPSDAIRKIAVNELLRILHAERAEELPSVHWEDPTSHQPLYLLDDSDLRASLGGQIGKIAASHHWDVDQVGKEFEQVLGAEPFLAGEWGLDRLKVACLLRIADACHIDSRRAPTFLRAIRRPGGVSADHWGFQNALRVPAINGSRLEFTSGRAFADSEASAWWLCFDIISSVVDQELARVDSLLLDAGRRRLLVQSVAGAGDPRRFAQYVPTTGWVPVDCQVRVGDVASLVVRLGGEELYGPRPQVAVRELIQNAGDAIRARRVEDGQAGQGTVRVSLFERDGQNVLSVMDTGIGMSEEVLTGPFVDFGRSYWASSLAQQEHPGLLGAGFTPTGRYGIGFFSVFMLGDDVKVVTQPYRAGRADTRVLEFKDGLAERPLLRRARENEFVPNGGTRVEVVLRKALTDQGGPFFEDAPISVAKQIAALCPCVDMNIELDHQGEVTTIVHGNDWFDIPALDLVARLAALDPETIRSDAPELAAHIERGLRDIRNASGALVGRVALLPDLMIPLPLQGHRFDITLTVGGLAASSAREGVGVLQARPLRASREEAEPLATITELAPWATEQALLAQQGALSERQLLDIAATVVSVDGDVSGLPISVTNLGFMRHEQVVEWLSSRFSVRVFDHHLLARDSREQLVLDDDVLVGVGDGLTLSTRHGFYIYLGHHVDRWPYPKARTPIAEDEWDEWPSLTHSLLWNVLLAASEAWSMTIEELVEKIQIGRMTESRYGINRDGEQMSYPEAILNRTRPDN